MTRKTSLLQSVQVLRALAAMAVAAYHTQATFARHASGDVALETYLFKFGAVGVHVFFVISGLVMVITTSGKRFSVPKFLKRRFVRIYPIYWICVALYVLVYAVIGEPYSLGPGEWFGALLLYPGVSSKIIGPGWTLAFEVFFYLSFALAMSLTTLSRRITQEMALIALACVFAGAIVAGRVVPHSSALLWVMTNVLLVEFLAGAGLGWLIAHDRLPERYGLALLVLAVVGYAVAIIIGYDSTTRVLTMGIASFLLVLGAVAHERAHGVPRALRWLARYGDSSYALYLIHVLIVALLIRGALALGWADVVAPWLVAVATLPVLVIIAQKLHFKLEQPILARLNRQDVAARPKRRALENSAG